MVHRCITKKSTEQNGDSRAEISVVTCYIYNVCQHGLSEFQVSVVIIPYCNELLLGGLVNNWSNIGTSLL